MNDQPQNLRDLLQAIADETPDSRYRDRVLATIRNLDTITETIPDGISLQELEWRNIILDQWRTLAIFHQRIRALEVAITAGQGGHDHSGQP